MVSMCDVIQEIDEELQAFANGGYNNNCPTVAVLKDVRQFIIAQDGRWSLALDYVNAANYEERYRDALAYGRGEKETLD